MELTPGTRLGRYVLEEAAGQGSEGRVFYARQLNLATDRGMPCVVKVAKGLGEDGHAHFLAEAKNAMKLGPCRNIVRVIDADAADGTPFFVMEYADGIDLRRLLRHQKQTDQRPLPLALVYPILKGIADGLHYAHEGRKIGGKPLALIHRDIKPANTFITTEGETKILDFGISTRLDANHSGRHLFGTYRYMSPEHVQGNVCPAMDIYSLGVVAWEMLEGRPFREGFSDNQILPLILTEGNTPALSDSVPADLRQLIELSLSFDPSERPTALEFSEMLTDCASFVSKPRLVAERVELALGRAARSRETEFFEVPEALRSTPTDSAKKEPSLLNDDDAPTIARPRSTEAEPLPPTVATDDSPTRRRPNVADADPDAPQMFRRRLAKPVVRFPAVETTEKLSEEQMFGRTEPAEQAPEETVRTDEEAAPTPPEDTPTTPRRSKLTILALGVVATAALAGATAWLLAEGGLW